MTFRNGSCIIEQYARQCGGGEITVCEANRMIVLLYLFGLAIGIWVISLVWRILDKAGYSGALSLLLLIPFFNGIVFIVLLCVLAYGQWPRQQQQAWVAVPAVPVMPVYQQQPLYPQPPMYPQMGSMTPVYPPQPNGYQQQLPNPQYSQYPQQQSYPSPPAQY